VFGVKILQIKYSEIESESILLCYIKKKLNLNNIVQWSLTILGGKSETLYMKMCSDSPSACIRKVVRMTLPATSSYPLFRACNLL